MAYIRIPIETDPDSLAQDAFDYMAAKTDGAWEAHDGQLDTWQLNATARMAATLTDLASDVQDDIFRYFGNLVGIQPLAATSASVIATVTVDVTGRTIYAGTHFGYDDGFGNLYEFASDQDVVVSVGTTADVTLIASDDGVIYNNLGSAGVQMVPLDDYAYIASAVMQSATSGGSDAELDTDYMARLTENLQLMTPRPIVPSDFAILARNQPGVGRAIALDNFDPAGWSDSRQAGTVAAAGTTMTGMTANYTGVNNGALITGPGIRPNTFVVSTNPPAGTLVMSRTPYASGSDDYFFTNGYGVARSVTVGLVGIDGNAVSSTVSTAVQQMLAALRESTFNAQVIDPTFNPFDVQYDALCWPSYDPDATRVAINGALAEALSSSSWGNPRSGDQRDWYFQNRLSNADLAGIIRNVDGVRALNSVSARHHLDAGGYVTTPLQLFGAAPLAQPGDIDGTVN